MAYYVNLYETNKAYGGPEEGGWWYSCGVPVRAIPCHTARKAERVLAWVRKIAEGRNVAEGRREPSSVLCDGYYQAWVEREPAARYPTVRPHYE